MEYHIRLAGENDFDQIFEIWSENQSYSILMQKPFDREKAKIRLKKLFDLEEACFFLS